MAPILTTSELHDEVRKYRQTGLRIGFTCGAFDLLHAGHVDYLQHARSLCDRLLVAVNSDSSIRAYKDPKRPIVPESLRMKVVGALGCVDGVTLLSETRPAGLISLIKPDFYIKGGDYDTAQLKSASVVESYGGQCVVIPMKHETSTSKIIERIAQLISYATPPQPRKIAPKGIIFLDRDGTLIENIPFLKTPARVKLLPGVADGLKDLQEKGFLLVIVTNQQGLGLGYFDYDDFVAVNSAMFKQLAPAGVKISRVAYCPHSVADGCECRKPSPRLFLDALEHFDVQAHQCYMIGDSKDDVIGAEKAGCRGIWLTNEGDETESFTRAPDFRAAVELISTGLRPLTDVGLRYNYDRDKAERQ